MKFIHCADIHLDSPLESVFPPEAARDCRAALLSTFAGLVGLADSSGADALLIAGDLFDSDNTSRKTLRYVLDLFAAHPDLPVFCLAGNHDSGSFAGCDDLPPNLHLFGSDWTYYELGDVMIAGGTAPAPDGLSLSPDRVNIVLLHGQVNGSPSGDYAVSFQRLKDKHIDYLALGHIHSYREAELDSRGVACYSGCLMGRGFDECGVKGYVLVEVTNSRVSHRFVPYAPRTLHEVRCDVSGCASQLDFETAARAATSKIPQGDLVRLSLTGDLSPDCAPDLRQLEQALAGSFRFLRLRDETHLKIDPAAYENDISLKGEFIRHVLASGLDAGERERVIACGLRALRGEELDL